MTNFDILITGAVSAGAVAAAIAIPVPTVTDTVFNALYVTQQLQGLATMVGSLAALGILVSFGRRWGKVEQAMTMLLADMQAHRKMLDKIYETDNTVHADLISRVARLEGHLEGHIMEQRQ